MLFVVQQNDSFCDFWPQLAQSVNSPLQVASSLPEQAASAEAAAVLLGVAGAETDASSLVAAVRHGASRPIAVVGTEVGFRVVQALLQAGADHYFALPADVASLRSWVKEQLGRAGAVQTGAPPAPVPTPSAFCHLMGRSDALLDAVERARKVAPRGNLPALLTGETGTGKGLLAQAIHEASPRAAQPFVSVNCAALPASLIEAELFGYERGAFTDAHAAKPGLFEAADGGTLFLDEIGDLPLELQAKLLKVLDDRRVRRLGSVQERQVDVRLIAATHHDLRRRVAEGTFREDLFYRLEVVGIHLPPLRERGQDVVLLAETFLDHFSREYAMEPPGLSPDVKTALLAHPWPGNIRELRNAVERALVLSGDQLGPQDFGVTAGADLAPPSSTATIPFPAPLALIERRAAQAALHHCGGNKSKAAQVLRISRKRLYALLEEPALEPAS